MDFKQVVTRGSAPENERALGAEKRGIMPIYRLLREQGGAFDPEVINVIATAFEDACRKLGLAERTDPLRDTVASKVLEVAKRTHERDPRRLCERTLAEILK